jgi:SAM-dependent methyltransferase
VPAPSASTSLEGDSAKRRLADFWDKSRDYYAQAAAANPKASPERQVLLGYLKAGQRVFDLGCGSCENALWIPAGCRYIGFDVSTAALVMAAEQGRPGMRLRGDGERLPVATGSVDAVLSTYALEHFHEPGRTLLEAARIVRPGGFLLLVGSAWDLPYEMPPSLPPGRRLEVAARRLWRQVRSALDGRHRFDRVENPRVLSEGYVPDADAVHVAQSHLMVRFLEAAGLEILEHRTLPHRPDPSGARGALRRALRRVPLWRHGWGNTLIVAHRGSALREPGYEILPL